MHIQNNLTAGATQINSLLVIVNLKKALLTIVVIVFSAIALTAQANRQESLNAKVILLKKILDQADTLTPNEAVGYNEDYVLLDSGFNINNEISVHLLDILNSPDIATCNLDSLLSHDFLDITHSKDGRLYFLNWYSNNGGTWAIMNNIIHYKTLSNAPKNYMDLSIEGNSYCASAAWFHQIFKLKSTENKDLYLCLSLSRFCSTCYAETASVIEIISDSINFNYPAFIENKTNYTSCYSLKSRYGNIEKFEYSDDDMTIRFTYLTDDLTAIKREDNQESRRISGVLKWDGTKFTEEIDE